MACLHASPCNPPMRHSPTPCSRAGPCSGVRAPFGIRCLLECVCLCSVVCLAFGVRCLLCATCGCSTRFVVGLHVLGSQTAVLEQRRLASDLQQLLCNLQSLWLRVRQFQVATETLNMRVHAKWRPLMFCTWFEPCVCGVCAVLVPILGATLGRSTVSLHAAFMQQGA